MNKFYPITFKSIKMKAKDADTWLTALRSGEYKQGSGELCNFNNSSYCCLGVLQASLTGAVEVDEFGDNLGLPSKEWLNEHGIQFAHSVNGFEDTVKNPVIAQLVRDDNIVGTVSASTVNDLYLSFSDIADLLEACIEKH